MTPALASRIGSGAIAAALAPARDDPPRAPVAIAFETEPDLMGGIELVVAGRKLDWNVAQYMDALEQAPAA